MLGFSRPKVTPPAGVYRPRNQETFKQQVVRAQGIKATTAAEAAQLLSLVENYIGQIGKFVNAQSQLEIMRRNQLLNEKLNGIQENDLVQATKTASAPEPAAAPTPEAPDFEAEEESYSDEEKAERVDELKKAIRVGKLRKRNTSREEKELKELQQKPAKPHVV